MINFLSSPYYCKLTNKLKIMKIKHLLLIVIFIIIMYWDFIWYKFVDFNTAESVIFIFSNLILFCLVCIILNHCTKFFEYCIKLLNKKIL